MPRLAPVEPSEMNDLQRRIADEIVSGPRKQLGELMKLWLHSPVLADLVQKVGGYFRDGTSLPQQIMEMIVLIVARHWNCEYEWVAHETLARAKGLKPDIIEAIRNKTRPTFSDAGEEAAYDYTRTMLERQEVPDEVFERVITTLGKGGFIDMSILIGHYVHGAIVLKGAGFGRPTGAAAPFPV